MGTDGKENQGSSDLREAAAKMAESIISGSGEEEESELVAGYSDEVQDVPSDLGSRTDSPS